MRELYRSICCTFSPPTWGTTLTHLQAQDAKIRPEEVKCMVVGKLFFRDIDR